MADASLNHNLPPFVPSVSRDVGETVACTSLDFARDQQVWVLFEGEVA